MAVEREKIVQQALKFAEKKRYDKAIAEYYKLVHEDPNDARALLKIGDLQLKLEAYEASVETYERVGRYYFQQGLVRKAIAVYLQIRDILARYLPSLDGKYAHILPRLAELYEQCGLTSDALAALDEVATKLLRAGRDQEAITQFKKIVALDPTNPLPHLRLAEALARAKLLDESVAHFSTAADILIRLDRRDDALKVLDRLMQLQPDPAIAKRAARLHLERGLPKDGMMALAKLQISFQSDSKDLDTLALLALAFEQIGQAPKAVEVQKEMVRLAKEQGKEDMVRQLLDHLLEVAPNDEVVRALARPPSSVAWPGNESKEPEAPVISQRGSASFELNDDEVEDADDVDELELEDIEPVVRLDAPVAPSKRAENLLETALENARMLRAQSLYAKAIEGLRLVLRATPEAVPARELLRDLLLEVGDLDGAVQEIMILAHAAADSGQTDRAASLLNEALLLDSDHVAAREMVSRLGYDPSQLLFQDTEDPLSDAPSTEHSSPVTTQDGSMRPAEAQYNTYDPHEPLPSYDLEEIGPGASFANTAELQAVRSTSTPFFEGSEPAPESGTSPLPSFLLEEEALASVRFADQTSSSGEILSQTRGFQGGDSIEEVLEEVDFFASRFLYDDAQTILAELAARFPNHPLVIERQEEIRDLIAQAYLEHGGIRSVPPERLPALDDDVSDALDSFEPIQEARPLQDANEQIDVEAVFAKFKEGVKAQVEESDSATHYDLGVAYHEMGLTNDAAQEFLLAARDPIRTCVCYWMVGLLEAERNRIPAAIEAFSHGLEAPNRTTEQEVSLNYELGALYEKQKNSQKALSYFESAERRDPTYRDVTQRAQALRKMLGKAVSNRPPAPLEEDFDSAFDNMIRGGRKRLT